MNNTEVRYVRGYVGDIGGEYNGVTTGQDELISALAQANSNLAVIILSGNAYAMPWLCQVPALVQAWFNGSETGHALADVLFGDVNPSGHLPFTIIPALEDYASHQYGAIAYPGVDNEEEYKEDLFVGYRYADLFGQKKPLRYTAEGREFVITPPAHKPLFAFGHGLSYTTFQLGKPVRDGNSIRVTVKIRPVKELKAFQKVALEPGAIAMPGRTTVCVASMLMSK